MLKYLRVWGWLCLIFSGNLLGQRMSVVLPLTDSWTVFALNASPMKDTIDAKVPGNIHTDLFRANKIPHPYIGNHEEKLQWISDVKWQYHTTFQLNPQQKTQFSHAMLQLDGIDTYADVFVNGKKVLQPHNMFRQWEVNIDSLLVDINTLDIVFSPVLPICAKAKSQLPYTLPGEDRVFVRKAQYHFGWDWGPKFITCGIHKPIRVVLQDEYQLSLTDSWLETVSLTENKAEMIAHFKISSALPTDLTLTSRLWPRPLALQIHAGSQDFAFPFEVDNPQLWYPKGYGTPYMYDFRFQFSQANTLLFSRSIPWGFRKVELIQTADSVGRSFYFQVNGIPIFAKGANYIPDDFFHADADLFFPAHPHPTATDLVQNHTVNMNMLRVWGGGVYETDDFYTACDKQGIMVWQDFMFACAMYPGDSAFLHNVGQELAYQTQRLRHHPSIVLWCGNNENSEGWHNWGWQRALHYSAQDSTQIWQDYLTLFEKLIPETLAQNHISTPYHPSSPALGWGRKTAYTQGDVHYWGVWWGKAPLETYQEKVGRFVSEYGMQGFPSEQTLRLVVEATQWSMQSPAMKNHQKHPTGFEYLTHYVQLYYPKAKDFSQFMAQTQYLQARAMKTAIEAHRSAKPYCMGSLIWQLNDCWPVISWSLTDYTGYKKPAMQAVEQAFRTVILTYQPTDKALQIRMVSDSLQAFTDSLHVRILQFDGKTQWDTTLLVHCQANTAHELYTIPSHIFQKANPRKAFVYAYLQQNKAENVWEGEVPKHLMLPKQKPHIQRLKPPLVRITSPVYKKDFVWNNHYFPYLIPGKSYIVAPKE